MSDETHDLDRGDATTAEAVEASVSMAAVRQMIRLTDEIDSLEAELKSLKADRTAIERELLEQMGATGVDHLRLDDRTVYRSLTLRASVPAEKRAEAVAAMRAIGLGDLVTEGVNAQTLSAQVREWARGEVGIPAEVRDLISVYEDRRIGVRRA